MSALAQGTATFVGTAPMPGKTMKAAVFDAYGGPEVVHIEDLPVPAPKPHEVLIAVRAATIASGDWRVRSATVPDGFGLIAKLMFGRRPKQRVLGTELAGVVVACGEEVSRWKVGDEVFAFPGAKQGAHAQYVAVREDGPLARKPKDLSFEEAAALSFGGATALSFMQKGGGFAPGQRVLVVGASGSVGSAMVQLAKHHGAAVTGVCSAANVELVRGLGADRVIDYTTQDFTAGEARYDVIVDTVGTAPIARAEPLLAPSGRLWIVNGTLGELLRSLLKRHVVAGPASEDPAYLTTLAELAEQGAIRPVIDSVYPLHDIVEAHRRVDSGHKRGNVVVTMG